MTALAEKRVNVFGRLEQGGTSTNAVRCYDDNVCCSSAHGPLVMTSDIEKGTTSSPLQQHQPIDELEYQDGKHAGSLPPQAKTVPLSLKGVSRSECRYDHTGTCCPVAEAALGRIVVARGVASNESDWEYNSGLRDVELCFARPENLEEPPLPTASQETSEPAAAADD